MSNELPALDAAVMGHLSAGTALGSYIVESVLGSGGMARVYKVRHAVLGSFHAIKVLIAEPVDT